MPRQRLPLPAPTTDKVQKKMSSAQGVGHEEPDYPRGSEEAVSRSESAPQRDAAAIDYLPLAEEESKGTVKRRSGGSRGPHQAPNR